MSSKKNIEKDWIVADVRRARAAVLRKHGGSLRRLCASLMEEQAKHPERVVNLRRRKAM
jgi:hypothetical protein